MTLGEKIKKFRTQLKLSQQELADMLYVTRTAVSKWETDKGTPDIENLKQLADLFDISVDDLVNEKDIDTDAVIDRFKRELAEERVSSLSNILIYGGGFLTILLSRLWSGFLWLGFAAIVVGVVLMAFGDSIKHGEKINKRTFIRDAVVTLVVLAILGGLVHWLQSC